MYYIQYKLNLKQTPLQSIQVPINFKCPEYREFTLLMSVPAAYSVPVAMFHHCKLHCGFYINLEEAKNILDTGSTEVNNGN